MENSHDHSETFVPAFMPDRTPDAGTYDVEKPSNPEQLHRQEFAALYAAAIESASPEEQLKLLREFEFKLRAVLEPGNNQNISIDDQGLVDAMVHGKGHISVGGGSLGQRIAFQSHRLFDSDSEQLTIHGRPGWMRYNRPTAKPGMDSTIGTQTWQRYAEYFGAADGYVQLAADADIKTEAF